MTRLLRSLSIAALAALAIGAVGCKGPGGTSTAPGGFPPVNPAGNHTAFLLVSDFGTACAGSTSTSEVLVFGLGVLTSITVPAKPNDNLTGTSTKLDAPYDIYVDNNGYEWSSNYAGATVTQYKINATGNTAPTKTWGAGSTTLSGPTGVYVSQNSSGVNNYVYVADYLNDAIDVFSYSTAGTSAPLYRLVGAATTLDGPESIRLDSSGNIWVANAFNHDILEFANPTATGTGGNVAPLVTLSGASTTLADPLGLYIDNNKNLWVTDGTHDTVLEFTASTIVTSGDPSPYVTLNPGSSYLALPYGVAVDNGGNVYAAGGSAGAVDIWPAGSYVPGSNTGAPTYQITGSANKIACPEGIQVFSTAGSDS